MEAMTSQPKDKVRDRQVQHIFKKYDKKGKGYITLAELKEMGKVLNEKDDDEEMLKLMIKHAGSKDKVTYQQFYQIMTKTVY